MNRNGRLGLVILGASLVLDRAPTRAEDSGLSVADLAAYRAALKAKPSGEATPASPVTFGALWRNPGRYRGQVVRVEGRVVRRFRQGAFGTFPPLVEAWIVSPSGDPFCLVYPAPAESTGAEHVSGPVRFEGTFLKEVRYQGGDGARLAPLIVGPRTPVVAGVREPRGPEREIADHSLLDWAVGAGVALLVAGVLGWQYVRKPVRPPNLDDFGPPPRFSAPPDPGQNGSQADGERLRETR